MTRLRWPILTLLLTLVALAIAAFDLGPALEYDRAILTGQPWRIATSQWTHWNADHLWWDVMVFTALGAMAECRDRDRARDRARFVICVAASAILIPLAVHLTCPTIASFRGLSGVDTALFTLVVGTIARDGIRARRYVGAAAMIGLSVALLAKIGVEYATATTLFVSADASFQVVPLAHLVGAAIGMAVAVTPGRSEALVQRLRRFNHGPHAASPSS